MNVVHLIDMLSIGGAQKLLVTFARQAKQKDVGLTVVGLQNSMHAPIIPGELKELGARVQFFPAKRILDPVRFIRLTRFLRQEQFDIIHTHLLTANILGGLAGRMLELPVISTLHSTGKNPRYANYARDQLETWSLRRVNRVVAVGESVNDVFAPILGRSLDIVPNGVTDRVVLSPPERDALRKELTGDASRPILIGVGNLLPDKYFEDMLTAFSYIHERLPSAALVIAGIGKLGEALRAQCERLCLTDHVFWLGVRGDIPRLMAASDIYISSSKREGLAIAMLEASMAALPIVVTSVGEAPRVLANGRGVLVPPQKPQLLADAVLELLKDPARRHTLGKAAREHALLKYAADRWFDHLMGIYREELARE